MFEKYPTPEKEISFDMAVEQGAKKALALIGERFERSPEKRDNCAFHGVWHTQNVIDRTEKILMAMRQANPELVSERDIALGCHAAAWHDVVQNWRERKVVDGQFNKILRQRFISENEKISAQEAIDFMEQLNREQNKEIFSDKDKEITREAIKATIPDFSSEEKTVFQPYLNGQSSPVARAVALADIGGAGMDGPEKFLAEGNALFREENLDINDAIENQKNLLPEEKEFYRQRIIAWSNIQISFAQGRKNLLETELQGFPQRAKEQVRALFDKFDDSIKAAKDKADERKRMSFEELMTDVGFGK
jgi:hypothetical protein